MPSHGDEVSRRDIVGGTYAYGYKLAASDVLTRPHPDARELCACRPVPTGSEQAAEP